MDRTCNLELQREVGNESYASTWLAFSSSLVSFVIITSSFISIAYQPAILPTCMHAYPTYLRPTMTYLPTTYNNNATTEPRALRIWVHILLESEQEAPVLFQVYAILKVYIFLRRGKI